MLTIEFKQPAFGINWETHSLFLVEHSFSRTPVLVLDPSPQDELFYGVNLKTQDRDWFLKNDVRPLTDPIILRNVSEGSRL